jgi:hypothetical protein
MTAKRSTANDTDEHLFGEVFLKAAGLQYQFEKQEDGDAIGGQQIATDPRKPPDPWRTCPLPARKGAFLLSSRCVLGATLWSKGVQLISCTVGFRSRGWHTNWHTWTQEGAPWGAPEKCRRLFSSLSLVSLCAA